LKANRNDAAAAAFGRAAILAPKLGYARWWNARGLRHIGRIEEATSEALAAVKVDRPFLIDKLEVLRKRGYLPETPTAPFNTALVEDAVRACMLDERCW
jgi:hypothetical protein